MNPRRDSSPAEGFTHEFFRPTSALWWLYLATCLYSFTALVVHFGATIAQV
ncbi:hypothetical protein SAMN05421595_0060 [Austwickia chelonae]|uniref:Uncharacterized protein n=1 Tax=Austwickia chelonae NBRC 105200 TaxID=1184607 RepID=K6VQ20_9MICO|nr:hypothetical protein [Austwickia chelonae]GAB78849.1 hypothetical protein AUCHE_17_00610 [Austwickia chelonae NBRC 105200]SEV85274.1 hypothetical protein SAMN05421595_0060 [Austwickia chelonae]